MTVQGDNPKKKFSWNPFQKLGNETETTSAAKSGAVVSGYIALSYAVQTAFLYWSGKDLLGNAGFGMLVVDAIALVLAIFLTWRIIARQPVWAAVLVTVWFAFELALKILAATSGAQPGVGFILMYLAIGSAAILSVRASWRLRSIRKGARTPETASEVFH